LFGHYLPLHIWVLYTRWLSIEMVLFSTPTWCDVTDGGAVCFNPKFLTHDMQ